MHPLLRNPVYRSLLSNDAHLGTGTGRVKWFDEAVSPFVGFDESNASGFEELHEALPPGRRILYAKPEPIGPPKGWAMMAAVEGLQFLHKGDATSVSSSFSPTFLGGEHVPQMCELATLTKPGPFGRRTIEFGHYFGVFDSERLAAMTGQRLHVQNFTEVSAVCTHPDFLGKGYATLLVQHQVNLILRSGQIPFLHVRADNSRAIAVYERLGFVRQGPMYFYFLKRQ